MILVCWVIAGRFGLSAICTAPPPITAPPAAHALSFAKAIRTDIAYLSHRPPMPAGDQPC